MSLATLTGNNGILTKANNAKIETILGAVKEEIHLEQIEKSIDGEEINTETLLANGKVQRLVQQGKDGDYYMYYALKENAYEGMQGLGKGNIASLKDVFLIDDNLNVKYIANGGKEYGDGLNIKVLDDETDIRFSSKAFSEYISKISGVKENEMKFKWMKNQTKLTISDQNVDSLQDLVFFPNLISLNLENTSIKSMDGIENCQKLETLSIIYGPDKDYKALALLPNLKSFNRWGGNDYNNIIDALKYCNKIEIVQIESQKNLINMNRISELKDLKKLYLRYNKSISKIEGLENKPSLTELYLADNKIMKIEGLDNLLNLKVLDLSNNQIIDITPLSKNTSLTNLNLKGNRGIEGDKNKYTEKKLEALNKIGEILDRDGQISLDIDKLSLFTNYKKLDLSYQNLINLESLEGLTQLTSLNLFNNKLTLEDKKSQEILKSMTNLKTLNLSNNKITNITAINTLENLTNLNLSGIENKINLVEIQDIISKLDEFYISTENLKTIINCNVDNISKLNIAGNNLTELPNLSKFAKLKELDISNNPNISNLGMISEIGSLIKLRLSNTNLHKRMINFSKLTNLTELSLNGNNLWTEDLKNLQALKNNKNLTIDLRDNSIVNANILLELDKSCKIYLGNNINLSPESKKALEDKFEGNISFF